MSVEPRGTGASDTAWFWFMSGRMKLLVVVFYPAGLSSPPSTNTHTYTHTVCMCVGVCVFAPNPAVFLLLTVRSRNCQNPNRSRLPIQSKPGQGSESVIRCSSVTSEPESDSGERHEGGTSPYKTNTTLRYRGGRARAAFTVLCL